MGYTYEYPRPAVSADSLLLRHDHTRGAEVLLIRRLNDPYKAMWALPGGFVEIDERISTAAKRELEEETGIRELPLEQFGIYDDINRDPRGRTITVIFAGFPSDDHCALIKAGSDATDIRWFPLRTLPPLAFDHEQIIADAISRFKNILHL